MIGAIVAEFFGGRQNALGVYIKSQAGILRLRECWSGILMACLLGIAFYLVIVAVERLLMPWHVSFQERAGVNRVTLPHAVGRETGKRRARSTTWRSCRIETLRNDAANRRRVRDSITRDIVRKEVLSVHLS